jgi:hypothetical protein
MSGSEKPMRPIRSFVRRQGRFTLGQQRALAELWPRYGLEVQETPLDLAEIFGRDAPRILEIGFGMGDALAEMALAHPENDYLGIEVHQPGVGRLLAKLLMSVFFVMTPLRFCKNRLPMSHWMGCCCFSLIRGTKSVTTNAASFRLVLLS